jgi:hypothetical protein
MRPSDRFRRQHEELGGLALEIEDAITGPGFPANAREVRRMMARFKGKLVVHSTMENEALYPRLLEHADPDVRASAQRLFNELGGIYDAFALHHARWSTVELISIDPHTFVRHTQEVFARLRLRVERENDELYPLADRDPSALVDVPTPRPAS